VFHGVQLWLKKNVIIIRYRLTHGNDGGKKQERIKGGVGFPKLCTNTWKGNTRNFRFQQKREQTLNEPAHQCIRKGLEGRGIKGETQKEGS